MDSFIYIAKSASILTLFYLVYIIVLRKDTFFSANRHYLISGIIASLLLPLLIFTKTVYVDVPVSNTMASFNNSSIINNITENNSFPLDLWTVIAIIYGLGIVFMSFRFAKQLRSLFKLIAKHSYTTKNGFRYIKVEDDVSPFSFFKYIVYNPEKHTENELKMILKHEQSHASQLHSIDIILSNLLLIIQWMNPFAWFYKKSIEENLEFIADSETVQQIPSKKEYQLSMLKEITSNNLQPVLVNNFYQSLIKKRIIMLHKNQSSTKNQWKLLLILPLLGFFLWSFNIEEEIKYNDYSLAIPEMEIATKIPSVNKEISIPEVSENNKKSESKNDIAVIFEKKNNKSIDNKITVTVDKRTTDTELDKLTTMFKEAYGVTLKFTGVKRNSAGEIIKIKVSMKSKNSNSNFNQDDSDGISEFSISYDDNNGNISIGNKSPHRMHTSSGKGNHYVYEINEDNNGNVSTWVSSDGHKVKKGKGKHVLHEIDEDDEHNNIMIISSDSGHHKNIWISKDENGNIIKEEKYTIIIDSDDDDSHGEEDIFYINSEDDDEDSIFVHSGDKKGIFIAGGDADDLLVFIDGKKSTKEAMEKLDSDSIDKIEVIKGGDAVKEYGEDAEDGVILITTKKN